MQRLVAVHANIPPAHILINVADITKVDAQWLGGAFGTHLSFSSGGFVVLPKTEVTILEKHGLLPQ
jgi:hypothetical protein